MTSKSLIDFLPKIVKEGKEEVEKLMEQIWSGRRLKLQTNEIVIPSKTSNYQQLFQEFNTTYNPSSRHNRLVYGDNLLVMSALLAGDPSNNLPSMRGKVDLIYIDPPFDSKADYRTKITLPWNTIEQKPTVLEQTAYSDVRKDGTASYLSYMYPRLSLMRELLSDTGSIYVHIDWHVWHYVKILLDEIFGKENFRNEIIWKYTGSRSPDKDFAKKHDNIFRYSKTELRKFFPIYTDYSAWTIARFDHEDEEGRFKITYRDGKEYKTYMKEGKPIEDTWIVEPEDLDIEDISIVMKNAKENTDYTTQKPSFLLERLLKSATEEGDLVVDFFGWSWTTAAVAEKLWRKWIISDIGKPACMVMRKRFIDQDAKPYMFQSLGDYQKEQFSHGFKSDFSVWGLAELIISLYGAIPFAREDNPSRNLGYVTWWPKKTLVYSDSPNKLTWGSTLRKAQQLRDSFLGGRDKVVVLWWNFTSTIAHEINELGDDRIEVLVIPPDLLDKLKSKKGYADLMKQGKVKFSSLQYVSVRTPTKEDMWGGKEKIMIELDNYILLSPEALPLDDKEREKLDVIIANDPLALIEYRSIDPEYDGVVFRSVRQDYRGNEENDGDGLRVVTKAELVVDSMSWPRKICVKTVDVFGWESEVVVSV